MNLGIAYTMCAECPDHVPTLCAEPCATIDNFVSGTAIDQKTDSHRPFSDPFTLLAVDLALEAGHPSVGNNSDSCIYSSPPLYLQFCVFLK